MNNVVYSSQIFSLDSQLDDNHCLMMKRNRYLSVQRFILGVLDDIVNFIYKTWFLFKFQVDIESPTRIQITKNRCLEMSTDFKDSFTRNIKKYVSDDIIKKERADRNKRTPARRGLPGKRSFAVRRNIRVSYSCLCWFYKNLRFLKD